MRKKKDPGPDPYLWLMDPERDPGGPKTCESADPVPDPDPQRRLNFNDGWRFSVDETVKNPRSGQGEAQMPPGGMGRGRCRPM
jgi:hypothetical protein